MDPFFSFVIKETKHILCDKRTVLMLFDMPIVMMLLFGFAVTNDVRNVRIIVVMSNVDNVTQQVADRLVASEYFTLVKVVATPDEAEKTIRDQKADMAIVSSQDFASKKLSYQLIVDGADPNMAQQWTTYASAVINNAKAKAVNTKLLYNPRMKSTYNFVPAIMGTLLMLVCAMMTSISIVREKEKGTMEVLLVLSTKPLMIIIARLVPCLVLVFAILSIILLTSSFILGVPIRGSLAWIYVVSTIYILLALSLGILVSTIVEIQLVALLISAMLLMMPAIMLSGMIFPIESMPKILQYISAIIPTRYYISAMHKLVIMGVGIEGVYFEASILINMLIALMSPALAKFNKRLEQKTMILKYLLRREFTQIRRNSSLPRLIITFPIMIMCIMPWVMSMEVKNIVMDVIDSDRSTLSQQLVYEIEANKYFIFHGQQPTYVQALKDIEHSKANVVVVIPQNYSRDLSSGRVPQVLIATNAVNGTKGALGSGYLSQIVSVNVLPSTTAVKSKIDTLYLYSKHLNFKVFMTPALLAMVMMTITGYLPTLNIVSEKEEGTTKQINMTSVSKWTFILSKLILYWMIVFFIVMICLLLSWLPYDITPVGSIVLTYLLSILLALLFSSFGLIISNYSGIMQQAIFAMWFFMVILLLLSGLFTSTRSMPPFAYLSTYINPVGYFIEAMYTVFIRGGNIDNVAHQLFALSGIDLFMGAWTVVSYKKNKR